MESRNINSDDFNNTKVRLQEQLDCVENNQKIASHLFNSLSTVAYNISCSVSGTSAEKSDAYMNLNNFFKKITPAGSAEKDEFKKGQICIALKPAEETRNEGVINTIQPTKTVKTKLDVFKCQARPP